MSKFKWHNVFKENLGYTPYEWHNIHVPCFSYLFFCNKLSQNLMSQSNKCFIGSKFHTLSWTQVGSSSAGLTSNHSYSCIQPAGWLRARLSWDTRMLGSPSLHVVSRFLSLHTASQCVLFRSKLPDFLCGGSEHLKAQIWKLPGRPKTGAKHTPLTKVSPKVTQIQGVKLLKSRNIGDMVLGVKNVIYYHNFPIR